MNETVETPEPAVPARPLPVLAPLIREALEAGDKAGLEHYAKAGALLIEAKEQVRLGTWTKWIEKNFHLSRTTAYRYMQLASNSDVPRAGHSTLSSATEPKRARGHHPAWHEPVNRVLGRVDMNVLLAEVQSREEERRLTRKLGWQVIDIGFKVLAARLHPDRGGPPEAMTRLNKIRKILKDAI